MDILQKIEDAAHLLNEAAEQLERGRLLELDFEIRIKAQMPSVEHFCITKPGENPPPSK